jgi:hypothetical protein
MGSIFGGMQCSVNEFLLSFFCERKFLTTIYPNCISHINCSVVLKETDKEEQEKGREKQEEL